MRVFCSICKDIFIPDADVKITDCGHLYHNSCITTWTRQHQTCPQCRANIKKPIRVYFDVEKDNETDPSTLEHQVETLSDKLRESENANATLRIENENYERLIDGMKDCATTLKEKNETLKTSVKALKEQVTKLTKQSEAVTSLQNEVETWKNKFATLSRVENLVKGSVDEVNKMLETTPVTQLSVRQLCTYVGVLKNQLSKTEARNVALSKENKNYEKKLAEEKKKHSNESVEVKVLKLNCTVLQKELEQTKKLVQESKKQETAVKKDLNVSKVKDQVQAPKQRSPLFEMDLGFLDANSSRKSCVEDLSKAITVTPKMCGGRVKNSNDKTVNKQVPRCITPWEELVCAGTTRNFGGTLSRTKSICTVRETKDVSINNSQYAFDGMGGRKKIRLGGPTPKEEFEKIKKKEEKKSVTTITHKKIFEYCHFDKV